MRILTLLIIFAPAVYADPLSESERQDMIENFDKLIESSTKLITVDANNVQAYSQRGDLYFFLGKFDEAVADYKKMVELEPQLDASHWRLGIAYFYANQFEQAAAQFGRYHAFDNVDRENGIWRYLSQHKAAGAKQAAAELLKYDKDDREPFGDVYKLFSKEITGKEILNKIKAAEISEQERVKRLFYANLYIGLNDLVEGDQQSAQQQLRAAVANHWPRKAGFGPNYMWHVARVQYDLLVRAADEKNLE